MKKSIFYIVLTSILFAACNPIEDRKSMGGSITADQLNITATPEVVNGKNSNKIILENHSPVLSLWDYGLGTSNRAYEEVLLVTTGQTTISFTGLNPDGTKITKDLTVTVDELNYEVPLQWGYLCGDGEKNWVWDDTQPGDSEDGTPTVYGNGGYLVHSEPAWWKVGIGGMDGRPSGEGYGAYMIFSLNGSTLTKVKADGSVEKGTFSFNMDEKVLNGNGEVWSTGKLYTRNLTVMGGLIDSEPIYEYEIMNLNNNSMALAARQEGTDNAYYWMFRAE